MSQEASGADLTRERLLNQAELKFSQKDFTAVSVRELTAAAGCNLGAVNYHFGSKHDLYLEVFRSRLLPRARRVISRLERLEQRGALDLEEVLRNLAQGFLDAFPDDEERQRHLGLMARELARPGEAFEIVFLGDMRPLLAALRRLVAPFLTAHLADKEILLCCFSLLSQVIYFTMARRPICLIMGQDYDRDFELAMVEHMVRFSLRGLPANSPREPAG